MPAPERPPLPENIVDVVNEARGGFNTAIGLTFTRVTYDEVVAEIEVAEQHHQPYGLVHGGVYATMIEALASTGAAINAMATGHHAVGLENSTSFLSAVRAGRLVGTATPLSRGRRSHVWQVTIVDEHGKTAATGRVRTLSIEQGAAVAGQTVELET